MSDYKHYRSLRLVLGDQLDLSHHWFESNDPGVVYLLAELDQEASYVKHHVQKICAFFAAMEEFANEAASRGHAVLHLKLEETRHFVNLEALIRELCFRHKVERFEFQAPDEFRLREQLRGLQPGPEVALVETETEHFLLPEAEFDKFVTAGKHNRMESFYRKMRKRLGILMDGDAPMGGRWNFDADNREPLRVADFDGIPHPLVFDNDVRTILQRIDESGIEYFGECDGTLPWPINRAQALELLEFFCRHCLKRFGRFQDAMTGQHEHAWSLFHSRLSFALNSKMLRPSEVIEKALDHFGDSTNQISISQIEGFVRQIIGWREYVRVVYWVNMPDYAGCNHLQAQRSLPGYFWNAKTKMNCMQAALGQSLEYAYAHHIQRLMITGNFCLLTGIDPAQVDAWYLGVYIDAIEWVEMPNTRGMSQFADGGLIATKPYCAGGNYINKMSDYCGSCDYDVKQKTSDSACPFNSLYWSFLVRNRERLSANPRIGMMYRSWDGQKQEARAATLARADWCLRHLEAL